MWWKKEPTISLAEHERVVGELRKLNDQRASIIRRYQNQDTSLRSEIAELQSALGHWERYGQLRDPATGRLVSRAKKRETV